MTSWPRGRSACTCRRNKLCLLAVCTKFSSDVTNWIILWNDFFLIFNFFCIFIFLRCFSVDPLEAREGVATSPHRTCGEVDSPRCDKAVCLDYLHTLSDPANIYSPSHNRLTMFFLQCPASLTYSFLTRKAAVNGCAGSDAGFCTKISHAYCLVSKYVQWKSVKKTQFLSQWILTNGSLNILHSAH